MCTVTVRRWTDGFQVTMNRDERRDRAEEIAPGLWQVEPGCSWMGPRDGLSGGTWIGVNELGAVVCLMNAYTGGERHGSGRWHRSRGEIATHLLERGRASLMLKWLRDSFDPSPFPPFSVLILWRQGAQGFAWRGAGEITSFPVDGPWAMFTSSSWRTTEVERWRRDAFDAFLRRGAPVCSGLPEFHMLCPRGYESYAPLVRRPATCTRSITQITVSSVRGAGLKYWRGPFETGVGGTPTASAHLDVFTSSLLMECTA